MIGSIGIVTAHNGEGLPTWILTVLILCIVILLITAIRKK